jgi:hypothetical protein
LTALLQLLTASAVIFYIFHLHLQLHFFQLQAYSGYGLPITIMHPRPFGILYGDSFLDENGNIVNYYDQIYAQTAVYGILHP